jgi:hypothetical protein
MPAIIENEMDTNSSRRTTIFTKKLNLMEDEKKQFSFAERLDNDGRKI